MGEHIANSGGGLYAGDDPVVVQQAFSVAPDVVWDAITDVDQMRQWYFDNIPAFAAEVGFETQFDIHNEGRLFAHRWRVSRVIPGWLIEYDWRYDGYAGFGRVKFELELEAGGTMLTLSNETVESFPDDIPEFQRESCIGGWNYFIKERLPEYLDGRA